VATVILANTMTRALFSSMAEYVGVVERHHGHAMVCSRNPAMSMKLRSEMAVGGWHRELYELMHVCSDRAALERSRFLTPAEFAIASVGEIVEDDRLAYHTHIFAIQLIGHRWAFSSSLSYAFPWKAAGLINEDPEVVMKELRDLNLWWNALCRLDLECLRDADASAFRMGLVWPLWEWPRQLCVELAEFDFAQV
jgi:hypothetical protein